MFDNEEDEKPKTKPKVKKEKKETKIPSAVSGENKQRLTNIFDNEEDNAFMKPKTQGNNSNNNNKTSKPQQQPQGGKLDFLFEDDD